MGRSSSIFEHMVPAGLCSMMYREGRCVSILSSKANEIVFVNLETRIEDSNIIYSDSAAFNSKNGFLSAQLCAFAQKFIKPHSDDSLVLKTYFNLMNGVGYCITP